MKKLSLPVSILIASLVIGGFYYLSQINKQKSIERQQLVEQAKAEEEKNMQLGKESELEQCLVRSDDKAKESADYWIGVQESTCVDGAVGGGSSMGKCLDYIITELNKVKVQKEKDRAECISLYK